MTCKTQYRVHDRNMNKERFTMWMGTAGEQVEL